MSRIIIIIVVETETNSFRSRQRKLTSVYRVVCKSYAHLIAAREGVGLAIGRWGGEDERMDDGKT